jgi:Acetamidase/Formamidase family
MQLGRPYERSRPIQGAELGDVLVVDVLACTPAAWGYTVQIPAFGFLRERFPEPFMGPRVSQFLLITFQRRRRPGGRPWFLAGWPARGMGCEISRR